MQPGEAPKAGWAVGLPGWRPRKDELAEHVYEVPTEDCCSCGDYYCEVNTVEGRISFYDHYADPAHMRMERDQRRFRGSYVRPSAPSR